MGCSSIAVRSTTASWTPVLFCVEKDVDRLVGYIKSSKSLRLVNWCGDPLDAVRPHLFADADLGGCVDTQRSTSGLHFVLRGPHTSFVIAGQSKRQPCVSHSTPEAEMYATAFALRNEGLPSTLIWDKLLPGFASICFHEDNQPMIRVLETGKNPTMRYLHRTHRMSVAWLHECFQRKDFELVHEDTSTMCADVYTKALNDAVNW